LRRGERSAHEQALICEGRCSNSKFDDAKAQRSSDPPTRETGTPPEYAATKVALIAGWKTMRLWERDFLDRRKMRVGGLPIALQQRPVLSP
jgi:hypothetical protein